MPVALTTHDELTAEINRLTAPSVFLPRDDLRVRRVMREAEKLLGANPAAAYSILSAAESVLGNDAEAVSLIDAGIRACGRIPVLVLNKACILGNHGHFSRAREEILTLGDVPISEAWMNHAFGVYNTGALQTLTRLLECAERMNIKPPQGIDQENIAGFAAAMHALHVSESDLAQYMDVAGAVMKAAGMMFFKNPVFDVLRDDDVFLSVTLLLPADAFRAEELDTELASRLAESDRNIQSAVTVGFRSGFSENDRYPEELVRTFATASQRRVQ